MQPFDIFNATATVGQCADTRPWLVVEVLPDGGARCFPISGQVVAGRRWRIDSTHPDFAATGLTKSCFAYHGELFALSRVRFGRRRGRMTGSMLEEFRYHANV